MIRKLICTAISFFLFLAFSYSSGSAMEYIYHAPESENDNRYNYHWKILKTALEKTKDKYATYTLKPSPLVMTEDRQFEEMKAKSDLINVMIRDPLPEVVETLTNVPIPIANQWSRRRVNSGLS